uniref:MHD domain-containing protein n=1 Tax=Meloidogyne javanica TaxID=6303 RepID=A0A915MST2_MELJA
MINSIFIVNTSHDVILEKHYKSVIHRSVCDYFFDVQKQALNKEDIPPVIVSPHHYLHIILDEILDNGYPLCTEMNVLQDLIKPPNFLRSLKNHVTGETNISNVLPTGQLSNVPWRRADVKYANNEAYFDVIEEIDAIIDKQGGTISAEIHGS